MTLVIMLTVLGLVTTLLACGERARRRPLSGAELLRRAERKLEANRRRSAGMNDAAGQSWRNMID